MLFRRALARRKVRAGEPPWRQLGWEVLYSLRSLLIFGMVGGFIAFAARMRWTQLYFRLEQHSLAWYFTSIALMIVASVVTVSDNGLAFTAIAEIAGPFWSGRALGTQNTTQLLTAGVTPPLFGALIGMAGYPAAFAVCALFPLLAIPSVPGTRSRFSAQRSSDATS